jgi:hypothetical protein
MHSEMDYFERIFPKQVSISTDERGYIIWTEIKTHKNWNGTMRLGKHYFRENPIHISEIMQAKKGKK